MFGWTPNGRRSPTVARRPAKLRIPRSAPLLCTSRRAIDPSYVRHLMKRLARKAGIEKSVPLPRAPPFRRLLARQRRCPANDRSERAGSSPAATTSIYLSRLGSDEAIASLESEWVTQVRRDARRFLAVRWSLIEGALGANLAREARNRLGYNPALGFNAVGGLHYRTEAGRAVVFTRPSEPYDSLAAMARTLISVRHRSEVECVAEAALPDSIQSARRKLVADPSVSVWPSEHPEPVRLPVVVEHVTGGYLPRCLLHSFLVWSPPVHDLADAAIFDDARGSERLARPARDSRAGGTPLPRRCARARPTGRRTQPVTDREDDLAHDGGAAHRARDPRRDRELGCERRRGGRDG